MSQNVLLRKAYISVGIDTQPTGILISFSPNKIARTLSCLLEWNGLYSLLVGGYLFLNSTTAVLGQDEALFQSTPLNSSSSKPLRSCYK